MSKGYLQLLFLCCFLAAPVLAQSTLDLRGLNENRIQHQRKAMLVLGGWAIGNIALGASLSGNRTGEDRYFHQMNAYWNVVNLGIAGLGYFAALKEDPSALDQWSSAAKHFSFQKVLLFNAGLDVGYIMGGLYLTERARRNTERADRLRGFGKAIMLQGGFLLAFDLVNYFITQSNSTQFRLLTVPGDSPTLGLLLTF